MQIKLYKLISTENSHQPEPIVTIMNTKKKAAAVVKDNAKAVAADVPTYCDIKDQVEDIASITAYEDDEIRLWFTVICPRFELEESRLSNEPEPTWLARTVRSRKASGRF